jgi:hypothetical protein
MTPVKPQISKFKADKIIDSKCLPIVRGNSILDYRMQFKTLDGSDDLTVLMRSQTTNLSISRLYLTVRE